MSTKTDNFKTAEEYMKTSSKLISKSAIAMAEVYNKQFKVGYDLYSNFLNTGVTKDKNKSNFSTDLLHANIEILKKNMENISKLSEKTVSTLTKSYKSQNNKSNEGVNVIESIIDAYLFQTKQIKKINNQFFETFSKTFDATNKNIEKSYKVFKKNTEDNILKTEEVINNALKTYSSSINQSDVNRQELFDNINKQMEFLVDNSLKQWSELTQAFEKKNAKEEKKSKGK
jgi:hypothetical protein